jgi:PAS domain S-box-containing protein
MIADYIMAEEGISNFENWDKRLTPKTLSHHLTYATKKSTKFRQLFDRVLERKETAMEDVEKTREELIAELAASQRQIGALEGEVVKLQMAEEKLRRLNMVLRAIRNTNQLIARGVERSQLLDGVCQSLIENRGYYSAWVVLLDKAGRYVASAQAGLGAEFADLQKRLELGELPPCARKALETPHAVVIGVTKELCAGCPLEGVEKDGSKMSIRLTHGSQMYGVMTVVALPGTAGDSEEQELLEEVAADVAFALHSLEMEEARRKAEEELRSSEERYRAVVETAAEGIIVSQGGKIVFANRRALAMSGCTMEELRTMSPFAIYHPEDREKVRDRFRRWRQGERLPRWFPLRVLSKDGSVRWVVVGLARIVWQGDPATVSLMSDITEQVAKEEELRKSEERYRTLVDGSAEAIVVVQDDRVVFANRMALRVGGYTLEELQQTTLWDLFHPDDLEKARSRFQKWLKGERMPRYYPLRLVMKDGSSRWVLFSVVSITWDGRPALLILMEDVTEQKRLEDMLIESERRYRTVLEEMQDAYYETDLRGKLTFFSDVMAQWLGYSPQELTGMDYRQYIPEEERDNIFNTFNQVYRTGEPLRGFRATHITKDGRKVPVEYSVLPLRNEKGETIGFRGISRDVTEQLRMEEALRKSEERFRTVLDEMEDSYFELDIAGNFTFVNDALCRTMGYSREEILGKNYRMLTAEDDWEKVFKFFNQVYRERRPQKGIIFKTIRKDGSTGVGELVALPMRDEKGEVIGFRGVGRDISERIKAEEERKELERRAHLAARLASVGEMASGIAHEINNPLTGVIGYAQLLLARKDLPEDIRPALEVINDSAQRVASIIRRLLTFARQYKPERRQVLINEVVEAALRLRTYHLQTSNIKVTTQFARDLPVTIADAGQLQQVFLNIIMNAEAAMKQIPRQGRLLVKTELVDPDIIRISFKDNGPGIAPEHLERIFEPFFTTSEVGEGTGLGLSVCHGIITEHKGRIWAESQPGKGATFFIDLPVVTAVVEEPVVKEVEKPSPLRKARVLVVDDEPVVREFVSQVLSAEGYEVDTAGNAEEALERVRSRRYRLILLDIKMPGTSGIELYQQFRSLIPALARRTLFITGDVMGASTRDFLTRTRAPYIAKPFDASKLVGEVRRALSRS